MEQSKFLCGGVSLCHSLVDNKHCYEVENALTRCSSTFRKGDIISMINNEKTQDLPPKKFIRMLSSESPMLTIHQTSVNMEEGPNGSKQIVHKVSSDMEKGQCLESDSIHAVSKERIKLDFQLAMFREEDLEAEKGSKMEFIWESDDNEDKEFFLVSMSQTSVAVVEGRGCDSENPCNNCGTSKCKVNDIVVASKTCKVTSVSSKNIIMSVELDVMMCSLFAIKPCKNMSFSENVTIYYYKSNVFGDLSRGSPVVLNITGTSNFLKCTCKDQKVALSVECNEKEKLRNICKDDPVTWPFVFYMKTTRVNHRLFESAANQGWFIQTEKPKAGMSVGCQTDKTTQEKFFFVIHPKQT